MMTCKYCGPQETRNKLRVQFVNLFKEFGKGDPRNFWADPDNEMRQYLLFGDYVPAPENVTVYHTEMPKKFVLRGGYEFVRNDLYEEGGTIRKVNPQDNLLKRLWGVKNSKVIGTWNTFEELRNRITGIV
jgi:hypothetical protein